MFLCLLKFIEMLRCPPPLSWSLLGIGPSELLQDTFFWEAGCHLCIVPGLLVAGTVCRVCAFLFVFALWTSEWVNIAVSWLLTACCYCEWVNIAVSWLLTACCYCEWVNIAVSWLLTACCCCEWVNIAVSWLLTACCYCEWVNIAVSWLLTACCYCTTHSNGSAASWRLC